MIQNFNLFQLCTIAGMNRVLRCQDEWHSGILHPTAFRRIAMAKHKLFVEQKKNVSPTGLGKSSRPWESEKECPLKINEKPLVGIKRFGRVRLLLGFALRLPPHRHDPGKPTHQGRCFFFDKFVRITLVKVYEKQLSLYDPITNASLVLRRSRMTGRSPAV